MDLEAHSRYLERRIGEVEVCLLDSMAGNRIAYAILHMIASAALKTLWKIATLLLLRIPCSGQHAVRTRRSKAANGLDHGS